ncbi:hypothetical protein [Sinomonas sp. ASV322]|uniref:hypothetical protein n=1 Tax=Sinomonas sp. ASV322 TaxID=3041920 RepID=UPI0027DEA7D1|nr:hypothetical protein [Sinomonas sp. ASV322]MDQ4503168.1 hypothetical protein [Sinomonas sp. ASV322]
MPVPALLVDNAIHERPEPREDRTDRPGDDDRGDTKEAQTSAGLKRSTTPTRFFLCEMIAAPGDGEPRANEPSKLNPMYSDTPPGTER